jgi:hypothetical protein
MFIACYIILLKANSRYRNEEKRREAKKGGR